MEEVTKIGLDLAKLVFQVHGANGSGVPLFNRTSSGGLKCCGSFRNCRPASWGWRPVPVRTIGRGRSRRLAMMSG